MDGVTSTTLFLCAGATLAQDHGRLEAQVEALTQEVCALKEKWQRDRDALRIKEKQVRPLPPGHPSSADEHSSCSTG